MIHWEASQYPGRLGEPFNGLFGFNIRLRLVMDSMGRDKIKELQLVSQSDCRAIF